MVTKEARERRPRPGLVKEQVDREARNQEAEARINGNLGTTGREPPEETGALHPADTVVDLVDQADQVVQVGPMDQEDLEDGTVRVAKEGLGTRTDRAVVMATVIGFAKPSNSWLG